MNKQIIIKLSNYSYFLMMFFLPISLLMGNVFLGILFLSILFQKRKIEFNKTVIFSLLIFFLFTLINGLLKVDYSIEQNNYIKLLPILLLPYSLGSMSKEIRIKGLVFLFFGVLFIQIHSIIGVIDYYYFTEGKKYALKNYSKINEILHYERPYLGYFSVLNIIISYHFFKKYNKKLLAVLITLFSLLLIFIISARLAIIIALIVGLIILFVEFNKKKRIISFSVLLMTIFVFMYSDSPLKHRLNQINNDARVVIWTGAVESLKKTDRFFFGSGSQTNTRENLLNYYKAHESFTSEDEKNRFITKNYNVHNQYLNEILRGGIFGLIIFIIPQILLLFRNLFNESSTLELLFLISIICFCFVENILDRQVGVYLYAILLSFSSMFNKENVND
jgi:O-antigen ligase